MQLRSAGGYSIRIKGWKRLFWRESLRGDIAAERYRSRGLDKNCARDVAVGRYRRSGLEMAALERELQGDIAAGSYGSRGLEKGVLERELWGDADGCTQKRRVRIGVTRSFFRILPTLPQYRGGERGKQFWDATENLF